MCRALPHARSGFTLIEVLVAVVLLATGIVVILEGMQGAYRALEAARDGARTARLAGALAGATEAALLDRVSAGALPGAGAFPAPYDQIAWRRRIDRVSAANVASEESSAGILHEVEVEAAAPEGRSTFRLTTYVWVPPVEVSDGE